MITLWVIGYLFTSGMLEEESDNWKMELKYFALWPYMLGGYLNAVLFEGEYADKQEEEQR